MSGLLSVVLVLACPVGMAAMMAIPALLRRFRRPSNPANDASPIASDQRALARQGR
jgi:hypothetical protein